MWNHMMVLATLLVGCVSGQLTFNSSLYFEEVVENKAGEFVVRVYAKDLQDPKNNINIRYSLESTKSAAKFTINETTGEILTSVQLDREENAVFTFMVIAQCCTNASVNATSSMITVNVTDVNDSPPIFVNKTTPPVNLLQTFTAGLTRTLTTAEDADIFPNNDIIYQASFRPSLSGSLSWGDYFEVDQNSAQLRTKKSCDTACKDEFQEGQEYKLPFNLQARSPSDSAQSDDILVELILAYDDPNINSPVFTKDTYATTIARGTPADGSVLLNVVATDKDIGDEGTVVYSIAQDGSRTTTIFRVSPENGDITYNSPLDEDDEYKFTVIATDNGIIPKTGQTEVLIFVTCQVTCGQENTLIYIIAGSLSGVILILFIILIVFCKRSQKLTKDLEQSIVDKENLKRLFSSQQINFQDSREKPSRQESFDEIDPDYCEPDNNDGYATAEDNSPEFPSVSGKYRQNHDYLLPTAYPPSEDTSTNYIHPSQDSFHLGPRLCDIRSSNNSDYMRPRQQEL